MGKDAQVEYGNRRVALELGIAQRKQPKRRLFGRQDIWLRVRKGPMLFFSHFECGCGISRGQRKSALVEERIQVQVKRAGGGAMANGTVRPKTLRERARAFMEPAACIKHRGSKVILKSQQPTLAGCGSKIRGTRVQDRGTRSDARI